jgi:hypothetical protein
MQSELRPGAGDTAAIFIGVGIALLLAFAWLMAELGL